MKILFVLFSYFPYGGLQRDFLKILQQCKKEGLDCYVIAMSWSGNKPPDSEVIIPPLTGITKVGQRENFLKSVTETISKISPELVFGFNKMPGLDYYFAADSCFAKKAFSNRSWWYRQAPRSRQYLAYEAAVFGKDSKTKSFILSPVQEQEYHEYYPDSKHRMIAVPPGIEKNRLFNESLKRNRSNFRRKLNINDDDIFILQIGSGFSIKGVDRSLFAIASLPEKLRMKVKYFLVGDDRPEKYLEKAKKLKINHQFSVMGGREDIPEFLHSADLLLHPAYKESAGMVLLEAVIAGLPVLTTASSGYAYHVEKAEAGKVCPEPFVQQQLNSLLLQMIKEFPQGHWQENGIKYGQNEDLYSQADYIVENIKKSCLP